MKSQNESKGFIFDLSRQQPASESINDLMSVMEECKMGYMINTKYETQVMYFKPSWVVVLSNWPPPNLNSMSKDRWNIQRIRMNPAEIARHEAALADRPRFSGGIVNGAGCVEYNPDEDDDLESDGHDAPPPPHHNSLEDGFTAELPDDAFNYHSDADDDANHNHNHNHNHNPNPNNHDPDNPNNYNNNHSNSLDSMLIDLPEDTFNYDNPPTTNNNNNNSNNSNNNNTYNNNNINSPIWVYDGDFVADADQSVDLNESSQEDAIRSPQRQSQREDEAEEVSEDDDVGESEPEDGESVSQSDRDGEESGDDESESSGLDGFVVDDEHDGSTIDLSSGSEGDNG